MLYILRKATDEDKSWLEMLRRKVYREIFEKTWGDWDEARHKRHFNSSWEEGGISVIMKDQEAVGMIQLEEMPNCIEIKEIQILPVYQGAGLGGQVLLNTIKRAQEGNKDLHLSLGLQNDGAYRLYKRLGFIESERSATHIYMKRSSE